MVQNQFIMERTKGRADEDTIVSSFEVRRQTVYGEYLANSMRLVFALEY